MISEIVAKLSQKQDLTHTELNELQVWFENVQTTIRNLPNLDEVREKRFVGDEFVALTTGSSSSVPTDTGFTGSFMSGSGQTFDSTDYHVGAVAAGVLGVGFNTAGQLLAGASALTFDVNGQTFAVDSTGATTAVHKIKWGDDTVAIWGTNVTSTSIKRLDLSVAGDASVGTGKIYLTVSGGGNSANLIMWADSGGAFVNLPATVKVDSTVMSPTYAVRKAADESVTSSEVLQNDDELLFACAANSFYAFEFFLICNAAAAGDFTFGWATPAGATMKWQSGKGLIDVIATGTPDTALVESDTLDVGAGAGTDFFVVLRGIIDTSSTAGNLTLKWAQRVSNGTASKILANSYVTYRKIG